MTSEILRYYTFLSRQIYSTAKTLCGEHTRRSTHPHTALQQRPAINQIQAPQRSHDRASARVLVAEVVPHGGRHDVRLLMVVPVELGVVVAVHVVVVRAGLGLGVLRHRRLPAGGHRREREAAARDAAVVVVVVRLRLRLRGQLGVVLRRWLRVGVVVRRVVVGGRPQHGEPARAPRRPEHLLLAHRPHHRHLAVHPVYAHAVHS